MNAPLADAVAELETLRSVVATLANRVQQLELAVERLAALTKHLDARTRSSVVCR